MHFCFTVSSRCCFLEVTCLAEVLEVFAASLAVSPCLFSSLLTRSFLAHADHTCTILREKQRNCRHPTIVNLCEKRPQDTTRSDRTLLGAPGIATRSKDATSCLSSLSQLQQCRRMPTPPRISIPACCIPLQCLYIPMQDGARGGTKILKLNKVRTCGYLQCCLLFHEFQDATIRYADHVAQKHVCVCVYTFGFRLQG